jgi:hypothetical protein
VEFKNVLQGHHKTAWKQVLHEHFPEPVDAMVPVPASHARSQLRRKLPSSNPALHSVNPEQEKA